MGDMWTTMTDLEERLEEVSYKDKPKVHMKDLVHKDYPLQDDLGAIEPLLMDLSLSVATTSDQISDEPSTLIVAPNVTLPILVADSPLEGCDQECKICIEHQHFKAKQPNGCVGGRISRFLFYSSSRPRLEGSTTRSHLLTLSQPDTWIGTSDMSLFYMYLEYKLTPREFDAIYLANPLWFECAMNEINGNKKSAESSNAKLKKLLGEVDLGRIRLAFFPVCDGNHWVLYVLHNPVTTLELDPIHSIPGEFSVIFLDSLCRWPKPQWRAALGRALSDLALWCSDISLRRFMGLTNKQLIVKTVEVPQQDNSNDSGLYVMLSMELLIDAIFPRSQPDSVLTARWYKKEEVADMGRRLSQWGLAIIDRTSQQDNDLAGIDIPPPISRADIPILIILDLNGLLMNVFHKSKRSRNTPGLFRAGHIQFKPRPGLSYFLLEMARLFKLAIWSSRKRENMEGPLQYMNRIYGGEFPWEFIWSQEDSVHADGFPHLEKKKMKGCYYKPLHLLWNNHQQDFRWTNTLLIDDSPWKVFMNPPENCIFPATYDGGEDDQFLCSVLLPYLKRMKESRHSVPCFVMEERLGAEPVDLESGQLWRLKEVDWWSKRKLMPCDYITLD